MAYGRTVGMPNSKRSFWRTQKRRSGTAFEQSAQERAR
jgi:hypothetical protein